MTLNPVHVRMIRRLSLLALVAALMPAAASAQRIDSPYRFIEPGQSVGLYAGYVSTGQNPLELGPRSAAVFGARYSIRISGPFKAEATIGFMPSTRDAFAVDTLAGDAQNRSFLVEADAQMLSATAALRFDITGARTWNRLQPFLLAGGGVVVDISSLTEEEEELPVDDRYDFGTSFAGELGAGVELYLTDRLSLRADVRDAFWKLPTPAGFVLAAPRGELSEDEWVSNWVMSAGISVHF